MIHPRETCDYCNTREATLLRPVGFTTLEEGGPKLPLVKLHCGDPDCVPDDQMDSLAYQAVLARRRCGGGA